MRDREPDDALEARHASVLVRGARLLDVRLDEIALLDDDLFAGLQAFEHFGVAAVALAELHRRAACTSSPSRVNTTVHPRSPAAPHRHHERRLAFADRHARAHRGARPPLTVGVLIVARATVLWLAVAVPGRMRSSLVVVCDAIAEPRDLHRQPGRDVLCVAAEEMQVHPQRRQVGDLEQRRVAGEIAGHRRDVEDGPGERRGDGVGVRLALLSMTASACPLSPRRQCRRARTAPHPGSAREPARVCLRWA